MNSQTNSINPQELPGLVELLRHYAEVRSNTARMIAEDKSLRQTDNPERRADLYAWPKPEDTPEGKAADTLESLAAENGRLTEENQDYRERISFISKALGEEPSQQTT